MLNRKSRLKLDLCKVHEFIAIKTHLSLVWPRYCWRWLRCISNCACKIYGWSSVDEQVRAARDFSHWFCWWEIKKNQQNWLVKWNLKFGEFELEMLLNREVFARKKKMQIPIEFSLVSIIFWALQFRKCCENYLNRIPNGCALFLWNMWTTFCTHKFHSQSQLCMLRKRKIEYMHDNGNNSFPS